MAYVETGDGVKMTYEEAGEGAPLVMLHGWSQSAAVFKHQIAALSGRYRVIAPDFRGHGKSDKPTYGYRIARLAQDLREFLDALDLRSVNLLGHSMGCAVIWCYGELFGTEKIQKLISVDQPPSVITRPGWTEAERLSAGGHVGPADLYRVLDELCGPNANELTGQMLSGMVTSAMTHEERAWLLGVNLQFPRAYAAQLLCSTATQDWRDAIMRLALPTLVVSGRASQVPWQSQQWIHEQIAGSRLEFFEESEGGSHFMFLENPGKFNALVEDFLG